MFKYLSDFAGKLCDHRPSWSSSKWDIKLLAKVSVSIVLLVHRSASPDSDLHANVYQLPPQALPNVSTIGGAMLAKLICPAAQSRPGRQRNHSSRDTHHPAPSLVVRKPDSRHSDSDNSRAIRKCGFWFFCLAIGVSLPVELMRPDYNWDNWVNQLEGNSCNVEQRWNNRAALILRRLVIFVEPNASKSLMAG